MTNRERHMAMWKELSISGREKRSLSDNLTVGSGVNICFACVESLDRAVVKGICPGERNSWCQECPIDWGGESFSRTSNLNPCVEPGSLFIDWLFCADDEDRKELARQILILSEKTWEEV